MQKHSSHSGHRQRIKERYLKNGLATFHDYEILEFILTYAIARKDVKPIAKALLGRFKSFRDVLDARREELEETDGIGRHAALLIKLIRDSVEHYLHQYIFTTDCISTPQALIRYCSASMGYCTNEQFRVVYLNTKNMVIADEVLQSGTIDHIVVYPRTVAAQSLRYNAKALIFVHNHPSGDPLPSHQDRELTKTLTATVEPLGILVHDHIIIGKCGYYSFREHGEL